MATEALTQAFLVGRDAYLVETLAYRGILDRTTNQFRLQVAVVGSQVWTDWLTVDAAGVVSISSLPAAVTPAQSIALGGQLSGFTDAVVYAEPAESYEQLVNFDALGTIYLDVNAMCRATAAVTCTVKAQYWDGAAWQDLVGSETAMALTTAFTLVYGRSGIITKPSGARKVRFRVKGSTGAANMVSAVGFLIAIGTGAVGGADVLGPSASVASEAVLFDGTSGKLLKRATGTGIVHRTAGVDATSLVVESDLLLTDNVTGDLTTARHGFAPKAPADATKFLNGANPPAWATPAGTGLVLLASRAGDNTATSIDHLTRNAAGQSGDLFQSDYDNYVIKCVGLVPATNSVGFGIRVSTDGATFVSAANNYSWSHRAYGPGGTGEANSNGTGTEIRVVGFANARNTSTSSVNAIIECFSPLSTALWKIFGGSTHFYDTTPGLVWDGWSGAYIQTTALRGMQVVTTAGNIVSGAVLVYGVSKT